MVPGALDCSVRSRVLSRESLIVFKPFITIKIRNNRIKKQVVIRIESGSSVNVPL